MNKFEKIEEIKKMCDLMEKILEEHNIKLEIHQESCYLDEQIIDLALSWIQKFHTDYYKPYMAIRRLLPDEIWKRYEILGGFGRREEVKLITKAKSIMLKVARKKHDFFSERKVNVILRKKTNTKRESSDAELSINKIDA